MEGEPSTNHVFQPGDLIWAKMKGFPPWPAKVLEQTEDTPARRIPVRFFGTLETSFMKPNDLSDYLTHRAQHEIPRKQKDFNKAVQEIRKAAGLASDQDDVAFPVAPKSPPSSPTPGRTRQTSGRFLDVILSGGVEGSSRRKRSNSASTKSRSRASSSASIYRKMKDLYKKDRKRLDSESSTGSKRKMISGGILPGSDIYEQYADSTDFNALFGDFNDLGGVPDDNKSWRSKRSRGSSKIIDDLLFGSRTRNRSGSASGRRSRMISMSGLSGVSDIFEELFHGPMDIDQQAEQLMITLNNMPSDGSIDRPLSPELLNPALAAPVEFCTSCGFECRYIGGFWKCNSNHCVKYKESVTATSSAAPPNERQIEHATRSKMEMAGLQASVKAESVSSGERLVQNLLIPPVKIEGLGEIKIETVEPKKSSLVTNHDDGNTSEDGLRRERKKMRKVQVMSPRSPAGKTGAPEEVTVQISGRGASDLSPRRDRARPKHYKVEKTPPISASGHRHCVNCNGQVRPQMCGGNRHRWRCVDKKCRKWYGWVRSHEEIPKNVGRKFQKAPVKSAAKPMKVKKKEEEEELVYPTLKRKVGRPSKNDIKIRLKLQKEAAVAMASKPQPRQVETGGTTIGGVVQRRKYTKRKNKDGTPMNTGGKGDFGQFDDEKKRACSPLDEKEASYRPCAMEKRARWWTGEKRRVDVSPERSFGTSAADTAAAFRLMAHAVRSAAVTRADEVGTVNGSLDLLMDTLLGSMGPLLSLMSTVPAMKIEPELPQQLWSSSAVHIPTFQ